jgi:hypothetical protein
MALQAIVFINLLYTHSVDYQERLVDNQERLVGSRERPVLYYSADFVAGGLCRHETRSGTPMGLHR